MQSRLIEIEKNLTGFEGSLKTENRQLVKEGKLVCNGDQKTDRCFLFSDLLVLAKDTDSKKEGYKCILSVSLDSFEMVSVDDTKLEIIVNEELPQKKKLPKKWLLEAENKEEKEDWMNKLSQLESQTKKSETDQESLKLLAQQLKDLLEQVDSQSSLTFSLSQQVNELSTQLLEAKEDLNLEKKNRTKLEQKLTEIDDRIGHCKELQKQLEMKISAKKKKKKARVTKKREKGIK